MGASRRVQAFVLERQTGGPGDLRRQRRVVEQASAMHDGRDAAVATDDARDLAIGRGGHGHGVPVGVDPAAVRRRARARAPGRRVSPRAAPAGHRARARRPGRPRAGRAPTGRAGCGPAPMPRLPPPAPARRSRRPTTRGRWGRWRESRDRGHAARRSRTAPARPPWGRARGRRLCGARVRRATAGRRRARRTPPSIRR